MNKKIFADDKAEVTGNEYSSTEETCNTDREKHIKESTSFKYKKECMNDNVK